MIFPPQPSRMRRGGGLALVSWQERARSARRGSIHNRCCRRGCRNVATGYLRGGSVSPTEAATEQRGFAADIFDCQCHIVCGLPLSLSGDPLKPLANQLQLEWLDGSSCLNESAHTPPREIVENALDCLRVITKRPGLKGGVVNFRRARQRLCRRVQR